MDNKINLWNRGCKYLFLLHSFLQKTLWNGLMGGRLVSPLYCMCYCFKLFMFLSFDAEKKIQWKKELIEKLLKERANVILTTKGIDDMALEASYQRLNWVCSMDLFIIFASIWLSGTLATWIQWNCDYLNAIALWKWTRNVILQLFFPKKFALMFLVVMHQRSFL
jgi:hypothetical protein